MSIFQIDVDGIKVQVERKKVKCIRLCIKPPDGRVYVSMPLRCNIDSVRQFVGSKRSWIESKQDQCRRSMSQTPEAQQAENAVLLWGRRYRLEVKENAPSDRTHISGEGIIVGVKQRADAGEITAALDELYRAQLMEILPELTEKWQRITGVEASEWRTRRMKTRWGSCNVVRKRIWLNVRLAMLPQECLEYVVAHELCHLHEPSHNRRFWKLMDGFMPGWRDIRRQMSELGGVLR